MRYAIRRLPILLLAILGVIIGWDILLVDSVPGCSRGVGLLMLGALAGWRHPHGVQGWPGLARVVWILVACGATVLDSGWLAPWLACAGILGVVLSGRGVEGIGATAWLAQGRIAIMGAPWQWFTDQIIVFRWCIAHPRGWITFLAQSARWVIPAVLGLVFLGLFFIANPVLSNLLGRFFSLLDAWMADWNLPSCNQVIIWIAALFASYVVVRRRCSPCVQQAKNQRQLADHRDFVRRCLLVFTVVFALQLVLDGLVFIGRTGLPSGMTHATYAHRGAYPLLVTALLTGLFVILSFRPGAAAENDPWCRRLLWVWLTQNLVLLVAALWRLHLYIDAYGLTRWRIGAVLWMGLIACGLGLIAWRIASHRTQRWLLDRNALAVLAMFMLCAVWNFDGTIAWHNVTRAREVGGPSLVAMDLAYLAELGPAAVPALNWYAAHDPTDQTSKLIESIQAAAQADLKDWRSWTLIRAQALHHP